MARRSVRFTAFDLGQLRYGFKQAVREDTLYLDPVDFHLQFRDPEPAEPLYPTLPAPVEEEDSDPAVTFPGYKPKSRVSPSPPPAPVASSQAPQSQSGQVAGSESEERLAVSVVAQLDGPSQLARVSEQAWLRLLGRWFLSVKQAVTLIGLKEQPVQSDLTVGPGLLALFVFPGVLSACRFALLLLELFNSDERWPKLQLPAGLKLRVLVDAGVLTLTQAPTLATETIRGRDHGSDRTGKHKRKQSISDRGKNNNSLSNQSKAIKSSSSQAQTIAGGGVLSGLALIDAMELLELALPGLCVVTRSTSNLLACEDPNHSLFTTEYLYERDPPTLGPPLTPDELEMQQEHLNTAMLHDPEIWSEPAVYKLVRSYEGLPTAGDYWNENRDYSLNLDALPVVSTRGLRRRNNNNNGNRNANNPVGNFGSSSSGHGNHHGIPSLALKGITSSDGGGNGAQLTVSPRTQQRRAALKTHLLRLERRVQAMYYRTHAEALPKQTHHHHSGYHHHQTRSRKLRVKGKKKSFRYNKVVGDEEDYEEGMDHYRCGLAEALVSPSPELINLVLDHFMCYDSFQTMTDTDNPNNPNNPRPAVSRASSWKRGPKASRKIPKPSLISLGSEKNDQKKKLSEVALFTWAYEETIGFLHVLTASPRPVRAFQAAQHCLSPTSGDLEDDVEVGYYGLLGLFNAGEYLLCSQELKALMDDDTVKQWLGGLSPLVRVQQSYGNAHLFNTVFGEYGSVDLSPDNSTHAELALGAGLYSLHARLTGVHMDRLAVKHNYGQMFRSPPPSPAVNTATSTTTATKTSSTGPTDDKGDKQKKKVPIPHNQGEGPEKDLGQVLRLAREAAALHMLSFSLSPSSEELVSAATYLATAGELERARGIVSVAPAYVCHELIALKALKRGIVKHSLWSAHHARLQAHQAKHPEHPNHSSSNLTNHQTHKSHDPSIGSSSPNKPTSSNAERTDSEQNATAGSENTSTSIGANGGSAGKGGKKKKGRLSPRSQIRGQVNTVRAPREKLFEEEGDLDEGNLTSALESTLIQGEKTVKQAKLTKASTSVGGQNRQNKSSQSQLQPRTKDIRDKTKLTFLSGDDMDAGLPVTRDLLMSQVCTKHDTLQTHQ